MNVRFKLVWRAVVLTRVRGLCLTIPSRVGGCSSVGPVRCECRGFAVSELSDLIYEKSDHDTKNNICINKKKGALLSTQSSKYDCVFFLMH